MTVLEKVRKELRITTEDFDEEINDLIEACLLDLGIAGVEGFDSDDKLVLRAVITYCKAHFGESDQYDRYKASYDEQKAPMSMATGYTVWSD